MTPKREALVGNSSLADEREDIFEAQTRRVYTKQWKTQVAAAPLFATQQLEQLPLSKRGALLPFPLHPSVYQSARILKLRGPACIDIQVRGHAASSRMTHYERLGIPDFADSKEIKKACFQGQRIATLTCTGIPKWKNLRS